MEALSVTAALADGVDLPVAAEEVEALVVEVLRAEGVVRAELSVAIVGDAEIEALNREYLHHEGPTDVISFPLPGPPGLHVGDVYVDAAQAARQAADLGVEAREELLRLVVHGTLHVLGYDHPEGEGREEAPMYRRQEDLLSGFLARARVRQ